MLKTSEIIENIKNLAVLSPLEIYNIMDYLHCLHGAEIIDDIEMEDEE